MLIVVLFDQVLQGMYVWRENIWYPIWLCEDSDFNIYIMHGGNRVLHIVSHLTWEDPLNHHKHHQIGFLVTATTKVINLLKPLSTPSLVGVTYTLVLFDQCSYIPSSLRVRLLKSLSYFKNWWWRRIYIKIFWVILCKSWYRSWS